MITNYCSGGEPALVEQTKTEKVEMQEHFFLFDSNQRDTLTAQSTCSRVLSLTH